MIKVTPDISIDEADIRLSFARSPGPGGQNVNKVETSVTLRFDLWGVSDLPGEVRERLIELAGKRVTRGGELVIKANRFRTQHQNRQEAISKLIEMIQEAAAEPKKRRRTRPTSESKRRRLEEKRRRGEIKRGRGRPDDD